MSKPRRGERNSTRISFAPPGLSLPCWRAFPRLTPWATFCRASPGFLTTVLWLVRAFLALLLLLWLDLAWARGGGGRRKGVGARRRFRLCSSGRGGRRLGRGRRSRAAIGARRGRQRHLFELRVCDGR